MSRLWEAPRTAYELAAEWAEQKEELAARAGGARGWFSPETGVPPVGKAWHDLRTLERHDVIAALGAQFRSAVFELRRAKKLGDDAGIAVNVTYYTNRMCEQSREALRALSAPSGTEAWGMPQCDHCAELLATALINMQVDAIEFTGINDAGLLLRMLASGGVTLPAQREGADDAGD